MQSIFYSSVSLALDYLWCYIFACHLLVVGRHSFCIIVNSFMQLFGISILLFVCLCFCSLTSKKVVSQEEPQYVFQ
jgi:hypothetical protein